MLQKFNLKKEYKKVVKILPFQKIFFLFFLFQFKKLPGLEQFFI